MTNRPTFFKLFALCAFLWVQAIQIDHVADQSTNTDHIDCVVCKSVGDAAPNTSNAHVLDHHFYKAVLKETATSALYSNFKDSTQLARAPPELS